MLNFIKEVMSPTTRSSGQQQKEKSNEEKCKDSTMKTKDVSSVSAPVIKGYKITDNERSRKYGIGASSLEMLKTKAKMKFPIADLHLYLASDGYEVTDEDYFSTLESQTLFVVAGPEAIITIEADVGFEQLRQRSPLLTVSDIICEFMEQQPDKFRKLISAFEKKRLESCRSDAFHRTRLSRRSEHAEWFVGQEEKLQTKEETLAHKARDRVRCYYYKTKDELTRNNFYRQNLKARLVIDSVLEKFRYLLIGCDYFSMLFDRTYYPKSECCLRAALEKDDETDARAAVPNKKLRQIIKEYTLKNEILDEWSLSLCSDLGDFYCQGAYSEARNNCALNHSINPYASRENLILFQVWNLDHQIELSRTILPSIISNVKQLVEKPKLCKLHKKPVVDISVLEYFLEIFSLKNLKLVHIVCHEKVQRTNKSNGRLVCPQCHEYKIVEELMAVDIAKDLQEEW